MSQPFGLIELAVQEVIEAGLAGAAGKVGGDLSYEAGDGFYVWLGLVPGGGSTDRTSGQWAIDIDVFGDDYLTTMRRALDLEALLLRPGKRTSEMIIDNVYQDSAPSERPWDDEDVFRVGSTYTFTARRKDPADDGHGGGHQHGQR